MGVRDGDDVQRADAAVPEVGRDHILADIELRARNPSERRNAAAIHEHAAAIGENDEQTIALADVDRGEL